MAFTEYSITYTATGISSRKLPATGAAIARDGFVLTGATGVKIGKLTRIAVKHRHTATKAGNSTLRASIVLKDGTAIQSTSVKKKFTTSVSAITNEFTEDLPSTFAFEDWRQLKLEILTGPSAGTLKWMATTKYPVEVTVYFLSAADIGSGAAAPTGLSMTVADLAGFASTYGAPLQTASRLRLTGAFTLDPAHPDLSAQHVLKLIDSDGDTVYTAVRADTAVFDVGALDASGTVTWRYTVNDSGGNSATATGTFIMRPYAAPTIAGLQVERYVTGVDDHGDPTYTADDAGDKVRFTFQAIVSAVAGLNAWTMTLTYGEGTEAGYGGESVDIGSGTDGGIYSYTEDRTLLGAEISISSPWWFRIDVRDSVTQATGYMVGYVDAASALFNVEKYGVAVRMRTTATEAEHLFEVAEDAQARFHGGIRGVTDYVLSEQPTGGRWIDGRPIYRQTVRGTVAAQTQRVIATIADIAQAVAIGGTLTRASDGAIFPANYYYSDSNHSFLFVNGSGGVETYTRFAGDLIITLEYTKTTDDPRTLWVYSDREGAIILRDQYAGDTTASDASDVVTVDTLPGGVGVTVTDGNVVIS